MLGGAQSPVKEFNMQLLYEKPIAYVWVYWARNLSARTANAIERAGAIYHAGSYLFLPSLLSLPLCPRCLCLYSSPESWLPLNQANYEIWLPRGHLLFYRGGDLDFVSTGSSVVVEPELNGSYKHSAKQKGSG